eukprot:scaffold1549_cov350-Prasinococcus_capsulatus_cf.AAC.13
MRIGAVLGVAQAAWRCVGRFFLLIVVRLVLWRWTTDGHHDAHACRESSMDRVRQRKHLTQPTGRAHVGEDVGEESPGETVF